MAQYQQAHGDTASKIDYLSSLKDGVNETRWLDACFSGDDNYVIAASSQSDVHRLFVWSVNGQLVTILDKPDSVGQVLQVLWHPKEALVASINGVGDLNIWTKEKMESPKKKLKQGE